MLDPNERLTDNTKIQYCKLCTDCKNRDKTVYRGKNIGYEKSFCKAYKDKPYDIVVENVMSCDFYKKDT